MSITKITPEYSVSTQISVEDVAEIAAMGYRSIMCNRPDGESPDQTPVAEIRAAAEARGLAFAFVPVISGGVAPQNVAAFEEALEELPAPVLAYCRSGTRCRTLWTMARS
ncbi:TIGR01244 family sulfur transferase [Amaricoccus solimangrovi]|uniref:TIGR01244 family phosphatase n=1 Tax=Amaricoccus solimangrovi TaxID=2589815 RepID=A0A501WPZ7_9RHOB|nr:TIGR01244 family sulfur transferase [Amaricoccus solimangrovi]TPE51418.1 TIGR01244 family phosphatase [Amaricoccus solimangrovi]